MMKIISKYIMAILIFLSSSMLAGANDVRYLRIIHLNVGQGDATLVIGPDGTTVLIDAGYAGQASKNILPTLKAMGIIHLDNIVATHFHSDHIAGFIRMKAFTSNATNIYDRGDCIGEPLCFPVPAMKTASGRKTTYAKYKDTLKGEYHRVLASTPDIQLGSDAKLTFLAAGGVVWDGDVITQGSADENAQSVVMLITYGDFQYFIGGDLTGGGGGKLNLEGNVASFVGDIDVYHSNHHGSPSSNSLEFLEALSPEVAIISVGDGNSYYLPKRSVLKRFSDLRSSHDFQYLFMTNEGNIDDGSIESDKEFISIATQHISLFAAPDHYIINGVIMATDKK